MPETEGTLDHLTDDAKQVLCALCWLATDKAQLWDETRLFDDIVIAARLGWGDMALTRADWEHDVPYLLAHREWLASRTPTQRGLAEKQLNALQRAWERYQPA